MTSKEQQPGHEPTEQQQQQHLPTEQQPGNIPNEHEPGNILVSVGMFWCCLVY
jgi:hypothetical protein